MKSQRAGEHIQAKESSRPPLMSKSFTGLDLSQQKQKMVITFQVALVVKNPPANAGDWETQVWPLGWEDSLEEGMATHSSILAWRIPWTEEAGGLQSTKSRRVRQNWSSLAHARTIFKANFFSQQRHYYKTLIMHFKKAKKYSEFLQNTAIQWLFLLRRLY